VPAGAFTDAKLRQLFELCGKVRASHLSDLSELSAGCRPACAVRQAAAVTLSPRLRRVWFGVPNARTPPPCRSLRLA
jgi:hypothetical protein